MNSPIYIDLQLGPPAFGGRYVAGLAARSALRGLGLAYGHPCTSLGRSTVFFLWAVFFGSWAALGPWTEAHGCRLSKEQAKALVCYK